MKVMTNEALNKAGIDKPHSMPLMVITESPENLAEKINSYREETKRFLFHFNKFKNNYPELFKKLGEEYPGFNEILLKIDQLGQVADHELTKEEMAKIISSYNFYAEQVNHVIEAFDRRRKEDQERSFVDSMNVDASKYGVDFTPEEHDELKNFADEIWQEMFPPSNVDRFMGWVTGQDISKQGKLRWFFAPANGIEMAVMGFVDLFKAQTYKDLVDTVQYMYGMSYEDWCDALQMLKLTYDNLSTDDTVNTSISIICSLAAFTGGAKIINKINKLKCAKKLKTVVKGFTGAHSLEEKLKPLPATVIGGMYLKYT